MKGLPDNTQTGQVNTYQYNGLFKDGVGALSLNLNEDFGLNLSDYGARWYDAAAARFWSVDPKSEYFQFQSPCVYAANDPILFVDENGENPIVGALIGATTEIGLQIIGNAITGQKWNKIDWADVGVATTAGALTGGLASLKNPKSGYKLATALVAGTAGQATEAIADFETHKGKNELSITGMQAIFPDGTTIDVPGTGITIEVKGKNVLDTGLDFAFDKIGDVVKAFGDVIFNDALKKQLKQAERELNRAASGSKYEATQKEAKERLERELTGHSIIIDTGVEPATDLLKEKVKSDIEK